MIEIDIEKPLHGSQGDMRLDVNLQIAKGEFVALMGKSGAGKTTLLRALAGLEKSEGSVVVDGLSWQDIPVQKREIGFVFQDYALFENMTIEENLLFVNRDKSLALELLELTELQALKKRNVKALSGGQKQRVALCRAMMKRPKILLMDEPLSALDDVMRIKLQADIKLLHQLFGSTTIMVSHNSSEVFSLASRVLLLEQGSIVKDGSPQEVLGDNKKEAEVLALREISGKAVATISYNGELIELEVDSKTKIGEKIDIDIKVEQV
jgi:molybdate transport system ATP-binding protein